MDGSAPRTERAADTEGAVDAESRTGLLARYAAGTSPRHRGPRAVLAVGVLLGLGYLAFVLAARPHQLGVDYVVYHTAAAAFLDGQVFYGLTPEGLPEYFRYVYPPVTILVFAPLALLGGWEVGFIVHTLLTVVAGVGTAWLTVDYLDGAGVALARLDRLLIGGYAVASVHAMPSLVFGQINHHLALAVAVGFLALARQREALGGAALGMAAFWKLVPAALGVWLLARRRVRAVAAATATGLGLLLAGVLAFGPDTTRAYVETAVLPRAADDTFAGGLPATETYLTLRRPISNLLPGVDPSLYGPLAALVCLPVLAVLYRDVDGRLPWLYGVFGTVAVVLLVFPSFPVYAVLLTFPLVALLYLFPAGRPRRLFLAGALVSNVSVRYDEVLDALTILDPPAAVDAFTRTVLEPLFTLATPPLVGIGLMLGACVWARRVEQQG